MFINTFKPDGIHPCMTQITFDGRLDPLGVKIESLYCLIIPKYTYSSVLADKLSRHNKLFKQAGAEQCQAQVKLC